jgi:hypothetical protein
MTCVRSLAFAVAVLAQASAAWAHHSYAAVDQTKFATVQGKVRSLEWTSPHVWVWIDVVDARGQTVAWGFEALAPSELARFFNWTKRSLTPGEIVTVDYAPLRSGGPGGALRTLKFPDGRVLRTPRSMPLPADIGQLIK